tara:strand:+ start:17288 stop:17428 length:141 start_codon:yes stop_codon:yes gene_type:complete
MYGTVSVYPVCPQTIFVNKIDIFLRKKYLEIKRHPAKKLIVPYYHK